MKRGFWPVFCVVLALTLPAAVAQPVAGESYYAVLADCNIAAYALVRYVVLNTQNAAAEKLKSLAPAFAQRLADFENKLAELEKTGLDTPELLALHRSFIGQYGGVRAWGRDLDKDLRAGNTLAVLGEVAKGKYLWRDLRDTYAILKAHVVSTEHTEGT